VLPPNLSNRVCLLKATSNSGNLSRKGKQNGGRNNEKNHEFKGGPIKYWKSSGECQELQEGGSRRRLLRIFLKGPKEEGIQGICSEFSAGAGSLTKSSGNSA